MLCHFQTQVAHLFETFLHREQWAGYHAQSIVCGCWWQCEETGHEHPLYEPSSSWASLHYEDTVLLIRRIPIVTTCKTVYNGNSYTRYTASFKWIEALNILVSAPVPSIRVHVIFKNCEDQLSLVTPTACFRYNSSATNWFFSGLTLSPLIVYAFINEISSVQKCPPWNLINRLWNRILCVLCASWWKWKKKNNCDWIDSSHKIPTRWRHGIYPNG